MVTSTHLWRQEFSVSIYINKVLTLIWSPNWKKIPFSDFFIIRHLLSREKRLVWSLIMYWRYAFSFSYSCKSATSTWLISIGACLVHFDKYMCYWKFVDSRTWNMCRYNRRGWNAERHLWWTTEASHNRLYVWIQLASFWTISKILIGSVWKYLHLQVNDWRCEPEMAVF